MKCRIAYLHVVTFIFSLKFTDCVQWIEIKMKHVVTEVYRTLYLINVCRHRSGAYQKEERQIWIPIQPRFSVPWRYHCILMSHILCYLKTAVRWSCPSAQTITTTEGSQKFILQLPVGHNHGIEEIFAFNFQTRNETLFRIKSRIKSFAHYLWEIMIFVAPWRKRYILNAC